MRNCCACRPGPSPRAARGRRHPRWRPAGDRDRRRKHYERAFVGDQRARGAQGRTCAVAISPDIDRAVAAARARIAELDAVEPHAAAAYDAVEALARDGASVDLLVLGGHKYRPVDHLLSGSTAQRLADDAPRPLVLAA